MDEADFKWFCQEMALVAERVQERDLSPEEFAAMLDAYTENVKLTVNHERANRDMELIEFNNVRTDRHPDSGTES